MLHSRDSKSEGFFFLIKNFLNVYLFLRERETEYEQRRGREKEGDIESKAGSRL